jgi:hypothetical protein
VAIKDGKETKAYTEKISKAIEFVNEHDNHPLLSQCVFVPFGRGAAIYQDKFCSLIILQNGFLHNIYHIQIHGLAYIDLERHIRNDMEDGEDISNYIREIPLDTTDKEGLGIFHSIKHMMKSDTIR